MSDREGTASQRTPLLHPESVPAQDGAAPSPWARRRERSRFYLNSKQKHYVILGLVSLDVLAVLTDILISLVTCDLGTENEPWVNDVQEATKICGLVFSSLFLVELLLSVWAFGIEYVSLVTPADPADRELSRFFYSWFHCFDAFVILISFVVDVLAHGILEEIGSLIIILRLWRFVKIVEEMSVGASEEMEEMQAKLEKLEHDNAELTTRLGSLGGEHSTDG